MSNGDCSLMHLK